MVCSPELADILLKRKTDVYGTARPGRKGMPPFKNTSLKKGEICAFRRGKCLALQWRDKKLVTFISTIHSPTMQDVVTRRNVQVSKPTIALDYNNTMGGVDRSDQNLSYYPSLRKGQKVYYKKLFRHFLDIAIFNAFTLYKKSGGRLSHLDFRVRLVEVVLEKSLHTLAGAGRRSDSSLTRLKCRHFPRKIPPTPKKQEPTRRCVVCTRAHSKDASKKSRKETRFWCEDCQVGLCVTPCFEIYHTKSDY